MAPASGYQGTIRYMVFMSMRLTLQAVRSSTWIVCRLRNRTTRMARPIADSAAATVRMKKTNTWPAGRRRCEGDEIHVHRQQHQLDRHQQHDQVLPVEEDAHDADRKRIAPGSGNRSVSELPPQVSSFQGRRLAHGLVIVRCLKSLNPCFSAGICSTRTRSFALTRDLIGHLAALLGGTAVGDRNGGDDRHQQHHRSQLERIDVIAGIDQAAQLLRVRDAGPTCGASASSTEGSWPSSRRRARPA